MSSNPGKRAAGIWPREFMCLLHEQGYRAAGTGGKRQGNYCEAARLPFQVFRRKTYFAFTLAVIEVTTSEAMLNWATRSVMPWRCAIHWKSV